MKRYHIILLMACLSMLPTLRMQAQYQTLIEVSDQANESLRQNMSENATKLVTALNTAFFDGGVPNLSGINMSNDARQNVL